MANALGPLLTKLTLTVVLGIGDKVKSVEWATTPGKPRATRLQNRRLILVVLLGLPALITIPVQPDPGLKEESVKQQCNGALFNAIEHDPIPLRPPKQLLIPTILRLIVRTSNFLGNIRLVWKQGPPTPGKKSRGTIVTTIKESIKAIKIAANAIKWCPTSKARNPLNPRQSPALHGLPTVLLGIVLPKTKPLKAAARYKVRT